MYIKYSFFCDQYVICMKLLLCNFKSNHKTSTIDTEPDTYFMFSVHTLEGFENMTHIRM